MWSSSAMPLKQAGQPTTSQHTLTYVRDAKDCQMNERDLFTDHEWSVLFASLGLPPRQREILRLITQGHDDRSIALRLGIQVSTVRVHLSRIFRKVDASDRTSLIVEVFRRFRELERNGDAINRACLARGLTQ